MKHTTMLFLTDLTIAAFILLGLLFTAEGWVLIPRYWPIVGAVTLAFCLGRHCNRTNP